jgi:phosphoglycolate phosphatase-like HAD superfamily hydrolase
MVAAERSGIHKIAVSWSGINRTSLQATYPDFIIDNPKQLLEIQKV